jgi:taurine dioxygenase
MTNQLETCGCEDWHCDGHFLKDPCGATVMNIVQAAGGSVGIADLVKAYNRLTPEIIAIAANLVSYNVGSRVVQPLVIKHPVTGRTGLFINTYAQVVDKQGKSYPEVAKAIREALNKEEHHYEWQTGDVLIVDNLAVVHKSCPADRANLEIMQRSQHYLSSSWWRAEKAPAPASCSTGSQSKAPACANLRQTA